MDEVRSPVVAGSFYPGSADRLGAEVDRLLASTRAWPGPAVHGIVVPHAGYPYSGPVAASAYACLAARAAPARIVIAGNGDQRTGIGGPGRRGGRSAAQQCAGEQWRQR